jgi:hypothetical protein
MDEEEQQDAIGRESSLVGFWAAILLFVLIGIATFVASKVAASLIGA